MTVLIAVTWPVHHDRMDEFWELMQRERQMMVRLGGQPTRYFESTRNPYREDSEAQDAWANPHLITGIFEYPSLAAWREMEENLAADPEFRELGAVWQERRDDILAGESTVMLHRELDAAPPTTSD